MVHVLCFDKKESLAASIIGGLQELAEKISDPDANAVDLQSNPAGKYVALTLPADSDGQEPWEIGDKTSAKLKSGAKTTFSSAKSKGLFPLLF